MKTVAEWGEVRLIEALRRLFDRPDGPNVLLGNGDDAAVLQCKRPFAWTIDSVVEGVDWLPGATPDKAIGHRAAAVNLSDLAAMGARPVALLLALELPPDTTVTSVLQAAQGLVELADRHGAQVLGGDVGLSPGPQRWTVTAIGECEQAAMTRSAARVGDAVWLAGEVGLAALGLHALRKSPPPPFAQPAIQAFLWPQPRTVEGRSLARGGVQACIDVSDGLGLDAQRLAKASGVALHLDLPRPPWLTDAAEAGWRELGADWRQACASGGDDYALLVTAPPGLDLRDGYGIPLQRIGRVLDGPPGHVELRVDGQVVAPGGWLHGG